MACQRLLCSLEPSCITHLCRLYQQQLSYGFLSVMVSRCFLSCLLIRLHRLGILLFPLSSKILLLTDVSGHSLFGRQRRIFANVCLRFPRNLGGDFLPEFISSILWVVKSGHYLLLSSFEKVHKFLYSTVYRED